MFGSRPGVANWSPDLDAIERVARMNGITRPVYVHASSHEELNDPLEVIMTGGETRGTHHTPHCAHEFDWAPNDAHRIVIGDWLSVEEANLTLWHELTHVGQFERDGSEDAHYRRKAAEFQVPYEVRPCEVEAREVAEKYGHTYPLVAAGQPRSRTWVVHPR